MLPHFRMVEISRFALIFRIQLHGQRVREREGEKQCCLPMGERGMALTSVEIRRQPTE